MRAYVWLMAKPSDERRYATAKEPSPEFAKKMKAEGYTFYRVSFNLPANFDTSTEVDGMIVNSDSDAS